MKTEGNEPIAPNGDPFDAASWPTHKQFMAGKPNPGYGLTKREYFASMAMQGLLASVTLGPLPVSVKIQMAVEAADALINELNKTER